jgi:hypothetical protein
MKIINCVTALVFVSIQSAGSAEPSLKELGLQWAAGDIPIHWDASLDSLASSSTVYRVTVNSFSPSTLSNLLALAGLTHKNRVRPSWDGARPDRDLSFRDPKETRFLDIVPSEGFVILRNSEATVFQRGTILDVPSWEEALQMAERILPTVGILRSDLARQNGTDQLRYTRMAQQHVRFDQAQGKVVITVISRELFLPRAFDGIPSIGLGGAGGVKFSFGKQGELAELKISWRNVEPLRTYPAASKGQFIDWLRAGKCVCEFDFPEQIKDLNIKRVAPYYFERPGGEPQAEIHPIAEMEAEAQLASTNIPVRIYCPLLAYQ